MIARVVIVPAIAETDVLDYEIGPELAEAVRPGMRVLVPLGARRAVGVVVDVAATSAQPRLKRLVTVLDAEPLLGADILRLCRWVADYYLCSLGEALTTALPGTLRARVERVVTVGRAAPADDGAPGEAQLNVTDREVLTWLAATGAPTVAAVVSRFGPGGRRRLTALERDGWVRVEDRLTGADGPTKRERYFRARRPLAGDELRTWQRRRPAQYALYAYLHDHPLRRARAAELYATFPAAAGRIAALVKAGLVGVEEEEVYRTVLAEPPAADRPVALTAAQRAAVEAVTPAIAQLFRTFLLWGVTGSGKTEVYMRCIGACLERGATALVLVPEISLTHQLVDRVRARFGERVAVLHSALSDGERWDEWRRIARGEVGIVVGARSAVFAPLPQLGLVVVDEEHDAAYKQEDGSRYNGRDVAIVRAQHAGCPALLGSATPAVESYFNAGSGRYELLTLPDRVEARPLPTVELVDLRRSSAAGRAVLISPQLAAALKANAAARGQSLVFLNRRGFANFLQCVQCGDTIACPNCSVTLSLHRRVQALRCHHCEYTIPPPAACPGCGGTSLAAWGAGTEQVEAALRQVVPGVRVGRMDRDTTSRKGALREIFTAWERREYDVLIGTQMVTKGHDVPGVTLVGVLLADQSLSFPDFRASERTFQLLTQVAGRAGRGERPGRVMIQTLQPAHFSLQCALQHDYRAFAEQELAARRELGYPPFARLVQLRCEGESLAATEGLAHALAEEVRAHGGPGVELLGPAPAPLERLRRRYRWQVLLRGRQGGALRRAARLARDRVRKRARAAAVRVLVDVDPYDML